MEKKKREKKVCDEQISFSSIPARDRHRKSPQKGELLFTFLNFNDIKKALRKKRRKHKSFFLLAVGRERKKSERNKRVGGGKLTRYEAAFFTERHAERKS